MMNFSKSIKGVLLDLDGVFYTSGKIIPGAIGTLKFLRKKNIPFRFLTNTTTINKRTLREKLVNIGLGCDEFEIISAGHVAIDYLRKMGSPSCKFFITENLKKDYSEFKEDKKKPTVIVIGDYQHWTFEQLNEAFCNVMDGAEILALQMGRYYSIGTGLRLDAGGFVKALEYATGKKAKIVGKPNKAFFNCALEDLRLMHEEVAMVGDDIITDIKGAQDIGIIGVLVKTGKYHESILQTSDIMPDMFLDSIGDLPNLFIS